MQMLQNFKKIYVKEHLLVAACDFLKQLQNRDAAPSVLTPLLSSDNLSTGYEKLSY